MVMNTNAKRRDETDLQYRTRMALADVVSKPDRQKDIISDHTRDKKLYRKAFVTHVESATKVQTMVRMPSLVDAWFSERRPGFEEPAYKAIAACLEYWEQRNAQRVTAAYQPQIGGGDPDPHSPILEGMDRSRRLDRWRAMFHPVHWTVFENTVRHGSPAGDTGGMLERNTPQAIASARAVVGLVANVIAMHEGF